MSLPSKIASGNADMGYGVTSDGDKVPATRTLRYTDADLQKIIPILNALITELGSAFLSTAQLAITATPTAKAIVAAHAAAIPVTGNGNLALTIADAAETNTLPVPTFAGQIITISADTVAGSGARTITVASAINATGNNTILLDAAGEFITLYGIKLGATFAWRVIATNGATLSTVG